MRVAASILALILSATVALAQSLDPRAIDMMFPLSYSEEAVEGHGVTLAGNVSPRYYWGGFRIETKSAPIIVLSVTKHSLCTATTAILAESNGTIISSAPFVGDIANFTQAFSASNNFIVAAGSDGAAYSVRYTAQNPFVPVDGTYVKWAKSWDSDGGIINYRNITEFRIAK